MSDTARMARIGDLDIAYYVRGRGFPVLMIQGLGGRAADWGSVPAALAADFEVITVDNRGTGRSAKPDEPYTLEQMADEAVGVLDVLGHAQAHVVGLSMGGMIAQLVALRHPQRVARLVLIATTPGGPHTAAPSAAAMAALTLDLTQPPAEIIRASIQAIAAPGFADAHPEVVQQALDTALAAPTPPHVFLRQMQAIMASDRYDRLAEISVPTLVIHGDVDPLVPHANGETLAGRIPGARLRTIRNCGHLVMLEQPAELSAALRAFLSDHR
jgi:pimeloyl-ACP methyl ester carboxylesterase